MKLLKTLWMMALAGALGCTGVVSAQTAASAPVSSPAKKELVARVLNLQRPDIENMAQTLAEQPAIQMMQRAAQYLQTSVPPEKREALAKEIQGDLKKYSEETVPLVRDRALKLAPTTIGAVLEEKFSEDELKQLIAILESPVRKKFQELQGEMIRGLVGKVVADMRGVIDPKVRALDETIGRRLGLSPQPAAANGGKAKPAAKAASK